MLEGKGLLDQWDLFCAHEPRPRYEADFSTARTSVCLRNRRAKHDLDLGGDHHRNDDGIVDPPGPAPLSPGSDWSASK